MWSGKMTKNDVIKDENEMKRRKQSVEKWKWNEKIIIKHRKWNKQCHKTTKDEHKIKFKVWLEIIPKRT